MDFVEIVQEHFVFRYALDTAVKIIKSFDEIAPYEKYSGGSEIEFSFLMEDIYGKNSKKIRKLRRTIHTLEKTRAEQDVVDANNAKILASSYSDKQIIEAVNSGKISASDADEYVRNVDLLKASLLGAQEIREETLSYIEKLKKELDDLLMDN